MKQLSELVTDKDIFDYVVACLIKQNKKSYSFGIDDEFGENGGCAYRGNDNTKCAVGHLIDNKYYDKCIENSTVYDSRVQRLVKLSLPLWTLNQEMLYQMQSVHDQFEVEQWEAQFSRFLFSSENSFDSVHGDDSYEDEEE